MGFSDDQYRNGMMRYLKSIDISLGRIASALEDINTVYQNRDTNQAVPYPFNPVYASKSVIDTINSVPNSEVIDTVIALNQPCSFCKNGGGDYDLGTIMLCRTCGKEHENFDPNDEFFLQNPRSCSFCKNGINGEWDLRLEVCHTCGKEHENFDPIERK